MIGCVVFDFDGTLVVSNEIKYEVFFEVTNHLPGSRALLTKILADPDVGDRFDVFRHLVSLIEAESGVLNSAQSLVNEYTSATEELIAAAPEVPGTTTTLETLATRGFRLAISSATPANALKKLVSRRKIGHFFSHVLGTPGSKEEHLTKIFALESFKPNETLLVGDSDVDRRAAKHVGCQFVGLGNDCDRFLTKPECLIKDLSDLLITIDEIDATA